MSYRSDAASPGPVALLFATGLPAAAILIELVTGWCAEAFFDPLPSFAHLLLVSLVPIVNLLIWMTLRSGAIAPRWLALTAGAVIAVAATYALLFLPILPVAIVAVIFFGIGLLPFAPLIAAALAIRWMRRIEEWEAPIGPWVALGVGSGFVLLTAADLPATAVHLALNRYAGPAAEQTSAVRLMRAVGNRDMLLRIAHGDDARATGLVSWLVSSLQNGAWDGRPTNSGNARELYYRVTGEAFNARPLPTGGLAARHRWLRFDQDLGGEQVGARVEGLSLASSRIDIAAAPADNLAYTEWTLEVANAADIQNEARFTLAMPEGAVASRATLWVNGEPREASVAGRAETRAAYSKVVSARRDPLLVTTDGAGRLLVQAFPIQPRDRMKLRIGYTAPFAIAADGRRTQALPAIVERNFKIERDFAHSSWVAGDAPLRWAAKGASPANAALRAEFRDTALLASRPRFETTRLTQASLRAGQIDGREPIAVEQRIERVRGNTRTLMLVLDGSAPMAQAGAALAQVLDALPAGLPVGLNIAADATVAAGGSASLCLALRIRAGRLCDHLRHRTSAAADRRRRQRGADGGNRRSPSATAAAARPCHAIPARTADARFPPCLSTAARVGGDHRRTASCQRHGCRAERRRARMAGSVLAVRWAVQRGADAMGIVGARQHRRACRRAAAAWLCPHAADRDSDRDPRQFASRRQPILCRAWPDRAAARPYRARGRWSDRLRAGRDRASFRVAPAMAAAMTGRLALFAAATLAIAAPLLPGTPATGPSVPEWPAQFEGRPLKRMSPTPLDERLARDFPGHIARFEDAKRQVVLRSLSAATRQLHPAKDCFGAIGYRLRPLPMILLPGDALASCFEATRDGVTLKVCERVIASDGTSYPDISSWYWPALLGRSTGPWLAAMTVERTS